MQHIGYCSSSSCRSAQRRLAAAGDVVGRAPYLASRDLSAYEDAPHFARYWQLGEISCQRKRCSRNGRAPDDRSPAPLARGMWISLSAPWRSIWLSSCGLAAAVGRECPPPEVSNSRSAHIASMIIINKFAAISLSRASAVNHVGRRPKRHVGRSASTASSGRRRSTSVAANDSRGLAPHRAPWKMPACPTLARRIRGRPLPAVIMVRHDEISAASSPQGIAPIELEAALRRPPPSVDWAWPSGHVRSTPPYLVRERAFSAIPGRLAHASAR